MPTPRTIEGWIREATRRFTRAGLCHDNGLETARYEAEYLVCHALGISLEEKRTGRRVTGEEAERIQGLLARRLARTPVSYLTREAFFGGMRFHVDERVLIPRSRIENLLCAPEILWREVPPGDTHEILDLCTGSGCLAICLAMLYPKARVTATDLSAQALAVAGINVERHSLTGRVTLKETDLFRGLPMGGYDLIVSNPPYVPRGTMERLPPEFLREPGMALAGGEEGLDLVLPILQQVCLYLSPGGILIMEVGDEVEETMRQKWPDLPVEWIPFPFGASGVLITDRNTLSAWKGLGGSPATTP